MKASDTQLQDEMKDEPAFIVGIGASAGGVEALGEFFRNVPANSGMAYVVILHLSPNYDSKLAEIIQLQALIPVTKVTASVRVKSDHVYVIPPDQHLMMNDGEISVSRNMDEQDRRAPVDIFFRTLAQSHGQRAVCVILSGTGANGSMGMKRIKEMGGAAFVQSPREAEYNEMPRNSIATELVDEILPVAMIPRRIIEYSKNLGKVHIPEEANKRPNDQQHALREVFTQLKIRTGHDFTNYKRPTLLRRIERRVNVRNLPDLSAYATYIQQNPDETTALLKDLLISVTNFFRDRNAFEAIEKNVLPTILRDKTASDQVRIWIAGCATGEEAYSLAMLCAEQTLNLIDAPKIQIFATDIDEAAITQAREGLYTINDAADVSPERLRRFFTKENDGYRIRREIREMILFASHNFIKDPPFSHLDLISCRNVLIYLNQTAQERVMETFHFALLPGAYLFLGYSESADGAGDLYTTFNREQHIFVKRQITASRAYPVPESVPAFRFEQQKAPTLAEQNKARNDRITYGELHHRLLEQYAAPSIVINEEYDIVHLTERAGRYLQMGGGEPTQNLLKLVRQELRLELRSALYQAVQRQAPVEARNIKLSVEDRTETIHIHVRPVMQQDNPAHGFILVLFERANDENPFKEVVVASDEPVTRQLEEELMRMKSQLRASNEQHEFNAEELKASNEELQAMNEELRSAAEELETSKEELQSINEELRTVNQELKIKVEETTLASNNLHNLINSVDIGTIFLDRSLRVAFFTPAARELFNLIPADLGRSLSDITSRMAYDHFLADVETVLVKLQPIEQEIAATDGRVFMMRILPYRTAEDRINGVVVTFIDITARKLTEDKLRTSQEHMRLLIESAEDFAIFSMDTERYINSWNTGAERIMGYTEQEIIGQRCDIIFVPEDRENGDAVLEVEKAKSQGVAENERWHLRKDGTRFYGSGTLRPLYDSTGTVIGFVKIMRDLTEAKRVQETNSILASVLESSEDAIMTINFENVITSWNKSAEVLYKYKSSQVIGKSLNEISFPEHIRKLLSKIKQDEIQQTFTADNTLTFQKGAESVELEIMISPVRNPAGDTIGISVIARDVSKHKNAEDALRQSEERFRTLTDAVPQVIWANDGNGKATYFNQRWFDYSGLTQEESVGPGWQAIVHPDDALVSVQRWRKALLDGNTFDTEYRLRRADGEYRWFIGRNVPLHSKSNKLLGWFGSATDIDDLKKAEEALRESRERLRITMESAIDYAIITMDISGNITSWSKGAQRIFGYTEGEVHGKYSGLIFTPEDRTAHAPEHEIEEATREGRAIDERWHLRKDGTRFFMSGVMAPIINNTKIVGFVKVARDMTASKLVEQQKEEFIGIASHELKTPVTSIKIYAEILQEKFDAENKTENAKLMYKLNKQVDRLTELIKDLLDTTRVTEGKLPLNLEKFDINALIAERTEELQRITNKHALVLNLSDPKIVVADKERIGQVLTNLISNAIQYSPTGGDIVVSSDTVKDTVKVSIRDSGIGIPDDMREKVFERFFRVGNAEMQTYPGMGLGLYISAGIIKRHGGTIEIEPAEGKGSLFSFTLPVNNLKNL